MSTKKSPTPKAQDLLPTSSEPTLLFAIRELLGGGIDFDKWWDEWKKGFYPRDQSNTNYKQFDWKVPKFKDLAPNSKSGCKTIEYWRDRDAQESSVILSGTPADLVRHIIQLEYEGGGGAGFKAKSHELSVIGQPLVRLNFVEKNFKKSTSRQQPVKGEITFRLIDVSDTGEGRTDKISKSYVTQLAKRIESNFKGFVWNKGKRVMCYNAPEQGFKRTWYLVANKTAGNDLLMRLLKVADLTLLVNKIRYSEATHESKAYPDKQVSASVLGERVMLPISRPTVDVVFVSAELRLSSLTKPIPLFDNGVVVYK